MRGIFNERSAMSKHTHRTSFVMSQQQGVAGQPYSLGCLLFVHYRQIECIVRRGWGFGIEFDEEAAHQFRGFGPAGLIRGGDAIFFRRLRLEHFGSLTEDDIQRLAGTARENLAR